MPIGIVVILVAMIVSCLRGFYRLPVGVFLLLNPPSSQRLYIHAACELVVIDIIPDSLLI